jgi:hypothetical protein
MTNTVSITFELNTTNELAELGFEAWVDDTRFIDIAHVRGPQQITIDMPDTDGDHELRLVLKGKNETHTKIDEQGVIVSDALLTINDIAFDEIKLGHMFSELATYSHDFNGTKEKVTDKFYGEIGCNGTASLKFATPVYLWLLENM